MAYKAPYVLLLAAAYVNAINKVTRDLDAVEVFAGCSQLTTEMRLAGLKCEPYEVEHNAITHDITTEVGFLHALHLVPDTQ